MCPLDHVVRISISRPSYPLGEEIPKAQHAVEHIVLWLICHVHHVFLTGKSTILDIFIFIIMKKIVVVLYQQGPYKM